MIRMGTSLMFLLMLSLVFVAGSTAGANAHGNTTAYQTEVSDLRDLDNGSVSNLSDTGVEGYYKNWIVKPTIARAEQIAVASYTYGYNNPQQATLLGYGAQATIWGGILYYLYKGYKVTKGAFKQ